MKFKREDPLYVPELDSPIRSETYTSWERIESCIEIALRYLEEGKPDDAKGWLRQALNENYFNPVQATNQFRDSNNAFEIEGVEVLADLVDVAKEHFGVENIGDVMIYPYKPPLFVCLESGE